MAYTDVLAQYSSYLILQYANKSKAKQTVQLFCNSSVCDGLPTEILSSYDLSTASGAQLDILGRIVGVPRNVIGLDLAHSYFAFTTYALGTTAGLGFATYSSVPNSANLFRRYREDTSYAMSDFELKTAIYLRIVYNTRFHTYKDITDGLYLYFNGGISVAPASGSVMTVIYTVKQMYHNAFEATKFLNIVPSPMGVQALTSYTA